MRLVDHFLFGKVNVVNGGEFSPAFKGTVVAPFSGPQVYERLRIPLLCALVHYDSCLKVGAFTTVKTDAALQSSA